MVWQLGDHDDHLSALTFFNADLRAHFDAATTGLIRVLNSIATKNEATCWEVWAFYKLHEVACCCFWVVDEMQCCIHYFAQVVRRNAGGHTYCNALAAVHQKVGETRWQHNWFFCSAVVCGNEVDRVFVDVGKQLHCQWVQT